MSTRTRRGRRRLAGLVAGTSLVAGLAVAVPAAPAEAAWACSGVTVVVDFTAFGGGVQKKCDTAHPTTGLKALQDVGYTLTGTQRYGLAFVCRINNKPSKAQDPCVVTPPANAYWSYWKAPHKGAWSYSSQGAGSSVPTPGTVEGWAFGAGTAPSIKAP
ncbi:hypothetical protein [Lapillicoccus jejuensis]|uniref:hypothetical protein n=1 Tax=Lapillicoccus jejuensis TaxID=402171 RepID=UPI001152790E|nr:hypothetical protein [Lapillicoccus jejuensis]